MATKRQSYTTSEKLKIIKFAEEHGNRAAQREFGIAESNVRLWRKSKENLQKMPRLQRADRGRKAAWPRLEQDLSNGLDYRETKQRTSDTTGHG